MDALKRAALWLLNGALVLTVGALVLDVLLGVGSRYLMGAQIKWTEELATVLLIWVSFLGVAAAFEAKAHLGIDLLTEHFAVTMKRPAALLIHGSTLFFVLVVFLIGGIRLSIRAVENWNVMPALQVSDVIQFLPLPVSGAFILLFELLRVRDLFRPATAEKPEVTK